MQGSDGNFYGTTSQNAQPDLCSGNCGTIFKITPAGILTTLYTFDGSGGYGPSAALVQGTDGSFYGTTAFGGNYNCGYDRPLYCGTVFKITPQGELTTLYSFCAQTGCPDGFGPSGLIQGKDGNFYGTTSGGGGTQTTYPFGYGTVFKITPAGALTTVHVFTGADGQEPLAGVLQGSDGSLYGTTLGGGAANGSTVFKITPAGTLITLHTFDGTDGNKAEGLVLGKDGSFYGTTSTGGADNVGTIFHLSIGIGGTSPSVTNLHLSPSSIPVGSTGPVVMTAQVVAGTGSDTPSGVVAFYNGLNEVGSADLGGGIAAYSYNPSSLSVNTYQITAIYSGDGTFASSTSTAQTFTVTPPPPPPPAATPSFSIPAGTYSSAQTVMISDATAGSTIYYTTDGTTPSTNSAVYGAPITINSTETIKAIAVAGGYAQSAVGMATYTINVPTNSGPIISSFSPAYTAAGGASFTLTITGSGFTPDSMIYWGTTALTTQYGSATQLTTHIPATEIASSGTAVITVQTGTSAGGTSNADTFEIDSPAGLLYSPKFTAPTAVVTAGLTATYPVTLPASAANVSASCLNLPTGAACSYSSSAEAMTISTSSTTPAGTYQITAVFTETVPGATTNTAFLPILLFPLIFIRRKAADRSIWLTAFLGFVLLGCAAFSIGCGGKGSSPSNPTNPVQTVTSSGVVTLTIQ